MSGSDFPVFVVPKRVFFLRRELIVAFCFLAVPLSLPAAKEALLIANADYAHFGNLPNPITDAQQLADVLRQIGFNVNVVENANREDMLLAIGDFEERLRSSRGIAFFHYGGHGVQVDGKNFLIPADANIPDEKRVATRAVDVDEVMTALDASGAAANVVVLDACRDNPLPATSTRSAARGLSVVGRKPQNSIIIYAAEAGNRAQDGLFTPTLSRAIAASGNRDISEVMKQVRKEVFERSGGAQTPGEYNQLFDPVVLGTGATMPQHIPPPSLPQGFNLPLGETTRPSPRQLILDYYARINSGDYAAAWGLLPESLQSNKRIHPQGYAGFKSWFSGLQPITVRDIRIADQSPYEAVVVVDYRFVKDGNPSSESLKYTLAWKPELSCWQIESVKRNR